MAAASALVQAAGLPCQISDARFIGQAQTSKYYEVACQGALGFIVVDQGGGKTPSWAACPDQAKVDPVTGKPNGAACFLPANMDDKAQLAPFIAKGGAPCDAANVRGVGHSPASSYFEVACTNGRGYVLTTTSPPDPTQKVQMISCLAFDASSSVACKLTTNDSQLALIDALAAKSGKNCTVKQKRYVLTAQDESNYYEVACADGKGYMLQEKADGSFGAAFDCAVADNIGGGCTFTNGREAKDEAAARYSRLANAAGYACDVSKYASFNVNVPGDDVVELACSNRPDGAVAIVPVSSGGESHIYNCVIAELAGYRCSFTERAAAYPHLTDDLKKLGKNSCVVSGVRLLGVSPDKMGYVEVACADGAPGYIMSYAMADMSAKQATACPLANAIAGGCKMPENTGGG